MKPIIILVAILLLFVGCKNAGSDRSTAPQDLSNGSPDPSEEYLPLSVEDYSAEVKLEDVDDFLMKMYEDFIAYHKSAPEFAGLTFHGRYRNSLVAFSNFTEKKSQVPDTMVPACSAGWNILVVCEGPESFRDAMKTILLQDPEAPGFNLLLCSTSGSNYVSICHKV